MTRSYCSLTGVILLALGFVGFTRETLFGADGFVFSNDQGIAYLVLGVLALGMAVEGAAVLFAVAAGALFLIVGLLGLGGRDELRGVVLSDYTNYLHLALGVLGLGAALQAIGVGGLRAFAERRTARRTARAEARPEPAAATTAVVGAGAAPADGSPPSRFGGALSRLRGRRRQPQAPDATTETAGSDETTVAPAASEPEAPKATAGSS